MKQPMAFVLILMLLVAAGCARPAVEPASDPVPAPAPLEKPAGGETPAPAKPPVRSPAQPATVTPPTLSFDGLIGARLTNGDPAFSSFLSLERYGEALRAVIAAYGQVREAEGVVRSEGTRFTLTLYRAGADEVTMVVRKDQSVVLKGVGGGTIRSPELTGALEVLAGKVLTFQDDSLASLHLNPGDGWVPQKQQGPWIEWANEGSKLRLVARYWPGVQLDNQGRWELPEDYLWTGIMDPVSMSLKGPDGVTYPALRFRPIYQGTGGGFWGTHPVEVAVVGKGGGLSLSCNQPASEQDDARRKALQESVDQQCPALLERFTLDLGEPVAPAMDPAAMVQQLTLQRDGLLLQIPGFPYGWAAQRGPQQWQITAGSSWLLDLARLEIRPTPLSALGNPDDGPFAMADGRLIGLKRDRWPGTKHITIVVQDPVKQTESEMSEIIGDVMATARAGESAFAYTLPGSEPHLPGALLQFDWSKRIHLMIAEQGWPVGLLADGRAVAHRARKSGPLFAWRSDAPEALHPLSPDGVNPYGSTISPDGRMLAYFHGETGSTSDYPRVEKVALYDLTSGQTVVRDLPALGYVQKVGWDETGNLRFEHRWPQAMAVMRLTPAGELESLTPPGETGSWAGWDGCAVLIARDNYNFVRHASAGCDLASGEVDLGHPSQRVGWNPLIAFPAPGGLEILDTRTGVRYQAPGASLPMLPVPPWMSLAPLRPESGYVALARQMYPQPVYQLIRVVPLER